MAAFNQTLALLEQGKGQVDLEVKVIQLAHIANRETGVTAFQQTGVYNTLSEIQSIINSNQSAVQQIISQGLVPNDTTLNNQITIIGILLAAGIDLQQRHYRLWQRHQRQPALGVSRHAYHEPEQQRYPHAG